MGTIYGEVCAPQIVKCLVWDAMKKMLKLVSVFAGTIHFSHNHYTGRPAAMPRGNSLKIENRIFYWKIFSFRDFWKYCLPKPEIIINDPE